MNALRLLLVMLLLAVGPLAHAVECIMPQAQATTMAGHEECPFMREATPAPTRMSVAECAETDMAPVPDAVAVTMERPLIAVLPTAPAFAAPAPLVRRAGHDPPPATAPLVASRMLLLRASRLLI